MIANAVAAATVLLLRDGPNHVETLLMRRHTATRAFPGAYVFPGGVVDRSDRELPPTCWRTSRPLQWWRDELKVPSEAAALGFLVAAIRETFEEAGVLLASHHDGRPVSREDLASQVWVGARKQLTSRDVKLDWAEWLVSEDLILDLDALQFWSWWVTPVSSPYRFDTRFFAARFPAGQVAEHDQQEITQLRWLSPRSALERFGRQTLPLREPTVRNLEVLDGFRSSREALRAASLGELDRRRKGPPPCGPETADPHRGT